jgi:repressor LexA
MKKEMLKSNESNALQCIRNYLVHQVKFPSIRELMSALGYKSPRSASLIIDSLIKKGFLNKKTNGELQLTKQEDSGSEYNARTVNVPLVGMISCGLPIFAEENIEAFYPVSLDLIRSGSRYFLLRVKGDSMDKSGINNGDFVLVRQQSSAKNGDIVVALINDEATIKEFHRTKNAVILKPKSSNPQHVPIILTSNFQIQGVVIKTIPNFN